jgi:hypothetical protein
MLKRLFGTGSFGEATFFEDKEYDLGVPIYLHFSEGFWF